MEKTKKNTTKEKDTVKAAVKKLPAKEKVAKVEKKKPTKDETKNLNADVAVVNETVQLETTVGTPADVSSNVEPKVKGAKSKQKLITGTGKRKTAVARVFLYETKGEFTVNGKDINIYFPTEQAQAKWMKPFHAIGVAHPTSKYSATIKVHGSGPAAQLSAVVHGFSRALAGMSTEFSEVLHKSDLLTRDPRMVERKKYWLRKARKAPQYSKR